jgi:hypothetical protein
MYIYDINSYFNYIYTGPNSYYTATRAGPMGTKIMGLSSYTLVNPISILYPMCVFSVTCTELVYTEIFLPICMCWFCTYHVFVYVLLFLAYHVFFHPWVGCLAHQVLVFLIEPLVHIGVILFGSLRYKWTIPFWGSDMLGHFTILKCVHMRITTWSWYFKFI